MSSAMKFRQRIAWLLVLLYLAGTFAFFNYVFEINDHYNKFALEHIKKVHNANQGDSDQATQRLSLLSRLWGHVTDLPLPFWLLVFLLPYLQLFMMILACTRAEPKHSIAYLWPGLVYLKYQQMFGKGNSAVIPGEMSKITPNGFNVIHT